jgi:hypothetical protein
MKNALLATLLALAVALGVATPAAAAPAKPKATKPSASYFGMHYSAIGHNNSYPGSTAIGSVRLWDTGTTWRHIQPRRGTWDWTVMDSAVDKVRANHASVLYVFGNTPRWAAKHPNSAGFYGLGSGSTPRTEADWVAYVQAVVTRYKGRIGAYELWNEFNLSSFYGGTSKQMVRLASLAYRTIKKIDPRAVVTSPSVSVRGTTGTQWMTRYTKQGGLRWADVINGHLYPMSEDTPEDAMAMFRAFRKALARVGGHKPIWNTEMNYGMARAGVPRKHALTTNQQIAYVLRGYILGWRGGVRRIYWYDWSATSWLGVRMAKSPGSPAAGPAGRAFSTARTWMNGKMLPCTVARKSGTYTCLINYGHGKRGMVRWNPKHWVTVQAPKRSTSMTDQWGTWHGVKAIKRVRVGPYPVLFAYPIKN